MAPQLPQKLDPFDYSDLEMIGPFSLSLIIVRPSSWARLAIGKVTKNSRAELVDVSREVDWEREVNGPIEDEFWENIDRKKWKKVIQLRSPLSEAITELFFVELFEELDKLSAQAAINTRAKGKITDQNNYSAALEEELAALVMRAIEICRGHLSTYKLWIDTIPVEPKYRILHVMLQMLSREYGEWLETEFLYQFDQKKVHLNRAIYQGASALASEEAIALHQRHKMSFSALIEAIDESDTDRVSHLLLELISRHKPTALEHSVVYRFRLDILAEANIQ